MTIYAHLSLTAVLEAAIKSLDCPYSQLPSEHWNPDNKKCFRNIETYLNDYRQTIQVIQDIMHFCNLATESKAISLLFMYLLLTRKVHEFAVLYEWEEPYTCRQLSGIPNYFGSSETPLRKRLGEANNSSTHWEVRIAEFDQKCAEFARILGMTPKKGGKSV